MSSKYIVMTAGGTGGHLFPALALCDSMKDSVVRLYHDKRVAHYLSDINIDKRELNIVRLSNILAIPLLIYNFIIILINFIIKRPTKIIGFGGYTSIVVIMVAIVLRIPIILHEQNAVMGRVNRILSRFAQHTAVTFPNTIGARDNVIVTGCPIRKIERRRYRNHNDFNILIIGGSQGARIFSQIITPAICALPKELLDRCKIAQQVRIEDMEYVKDLYKKHAIKSETSNFFYDIDQKMYNADLVISRSGASTIAEISFLSKPSILIPLKIAKDNHQYHNAHYLAENGATIVIEEDDLSDDILMQHIITLLKNKDLLKKMSSRMINIANTDALLSLVQSDL